MNKLQLFGEAELLVVLRRGRSLSRSPPVKFWLVERETTCCNLLTPLPFKLCFRRSSVFFRDTPQGLIFTKVYSLSDVHRRAGNSVCFTKSQSQNLDLRWILLLLALERGSCYFFSVILDRVNVNQYYLTCLRDQWPEFNLLVVYIFLFYSWLNTLSIYRMSAENFPSTFVQQNSCNIRKRIWLIFTICKQRN